MAFFKLTLLFVVLATASACAVIYNIHYVFNI